MRKHRRGLEGLLEIARPPTTPVEVTRVTLGTVTHAVAKQTGALCANGIDTWRVETHCAIRVVVTSLAPPAGEVTCLTCVESMTL